MQLTVLSILRKVRLYYGPILALHSYRVLSLLGKVPPYRVCKV